MLRFILVLIFLAPLQAYAQRYGTGMAFNNANYAKAKVRANFNVQNFEDLPSYYSLKAHCPSPGNQMQLNTSPAWATAWSAISILESHSKTLYDQKSINELTKSPPYLYQHIRTSDDQNCDSGIDLYEALKFVVDHQLHSFDDFKEFHESDRIEKMGYQEMFP